MLAWGSVQPNLTEADDTAWKSIVFEVSDEVLVGFMAFLVTVGVPAVSLCHVTSATNRRLWAPQL